MAAVPNVKSAKTRELFNGGVHGFLETTKSADPTCYNAPSIKQRRLDMPSVHSFKKGDVVTIFQMNPSKGLLIEGKAVIARPVADVDESYMVRFYGRNGKVEREQYQRFVDRGGQTDPAAYIREFNIKIGYAA
jgi:hypothetical protein